MKKLKLRSWVKVVILMLILISVILINDHYTEKDIDKCTSLGNSKEWCYYHLG